MDLGSTLPSAGEGAAIELDFTFFTFSLGARGTEIIQFFHAFGE